MKVKFSGILSPGSEMRQKSVMIFKLTRTGTFTRAPVSNSLILSLPERFFLGFFLIEMCLSGAAY